MFGITCFDAHGNSINYLTQWDLNQTLYIYDWIYDENPVFHFCNKNSDKALVVTGVVNSGTITVDVPNILLEEPYSIIAYIFLYSDADNDGGFSGKTMHTITLPVKARKKPDDYEYEDNYNKLTISYLNERISNMIKSLSTETDATSVSVELQDIRMGADGIIYDTAGEAVRHQTSTIPNKAILNDKKIKFYRSQEDVDSFLFDLDVSVLLESGLSLDNLELSAGKTDDAITINMSDGKIEKSVDLPIVIDTELNSTSMNPIQNRVVAQQIEYINEEIAQMKENGFGGGGGEGTTVRLINQNGTSTMIGSYGSSILLMFTFTSTEDDIPTGNANCKILVNGIQKANMNIPQGLTSIDVAPYLNIGSNTVVVSCTDTYGKSRSLTYDISLIKLIITSSFNADRILYNDEPFKYVASGSIQKTIYFKMDGNIIGTVVTSLSGKESSRTIPKQSHGTHVFEVYSVATLDDTELVSPILKYDLMYAEEGNITPMIASMYDVESVTQGEMVSIPYYVFDPTKLSCDVFFEIFTKEHGEEIIFSSKNITVGREKDTWDTREYPIGEEVYFRIRYGNISKTHKLTVHKNSIDIEPETSGLELMLSASGRSNNETNPSEWKYGGIETTFNNVNWSSTGWLRDDNGDACLRLSGDATATINFQPFSEDLRTYGKTIELEFAIRDVNNRNAIPISCMSGGIGFEVKADTAYINSEQSNVFCNYKEEERVHLAFVIESKDEYRMLSIFLNGVMSDAIQYPTNDNFQQINPVNISIGSPYCSVDLYTVRSYNTALADSVLTTNYLADISDISKKTESYEENDIYDEFGAISFAKARTKNSVMVIVGSLPTFKGDKKKCKIIYYDVEDSNLNYEEQDVSIDVQGTSSQWYNRKNWKLKCSNEHYIDIDQLSGKVICIKVDYAEATGTHNTQNAVFVEKLYSETIPPQETNPKVRTTIYGKPILLFHQEREGTEPVFYGKANYNWDKGAENVFGFTSDYDVECWEFCNNTSDACLFRGEIPSNFGEDFEARYPDGYKNINRFKIMHDWVVSTRQDTATGSELSSVYTDVDGNTYTHDTSEYRLAKFKTEFTNYFNMHYSLIYYVYTFFALMTDQRAKNMFLTYWGSSGKWYPYFYDNDTCFGINNEGGLVFDYYHEDHDQVDGANVYNGQLSTLWINFRAAFPDKIQETYQDLRSNSVLNYNEFVDQFITHGSDKWSESVYNEDGDFKYVSMLRSDGDATNLPQIRGTGEEHFRYFIENRLNYCDSKWYAGEYPSDNAVIRIYTPVDAAGNPRTDLAVPANASITVTPYSAMYAGVRYKANGTLVQERLDANETFTFVAPNETFNDTETAIYGASQLSSLGDLAPLYLGYIDVGAATKLVELKIGDDTPGYKNDNLYHLAVGTNRLLKKIDIQNCGGAKFNQALVLTGCPNIEEIYAKGSSITGVDLPDSGYLKVLQLPATVTNLTLRNQLYIEDLTIEGYENIKTVEIENCPCVDSLTILDRAINCERARLTNVDWHWDDASVLLELIERNIAGKDEDGTNTSTMWVDGKCHIGTLTGSEYATIKNAYPYLDITYGTLISQLIYMSEDGATELYKETIYNGGNGSCPVTNGIIDIPLKESTQKYNFTYSGWSLVSGGIADLNALLHVEGDRTVYATFSQTLRNYTVQFINGSTVEASKVVAYGTNATPCKKNLFNSAAFVGSGITNNSIGSITLSSHIQFFDNMLDVACMNLAVGETYVWSGTNLNDICFGGSTIKPNEPFILTEEMLKVNTLGFYALKSTDTSTLYTITNIQLELGNTSTVYEVYSVITPVNNSTGNPDDFEFVGWNPTPVDIRNNTDCYAQWYDVREIMDDWTTIAAACLDGTATDKYAIGAYKMLDIGATELPYDFHEGGAVVYDGEIHILGNDTRHYKWNGTEWARVSTLPIREYTFKNSTVVYNNEIHIILDGNHYKWNGSEWELVSTFNFRFHYGSAIVLNNEIHALGGYGTSWNHYKWNGSEWVEVSTLPSVFLGAGTRYVVYNNEIHGFAGIEHHKWNGTEWIYVSRIPASVNSDYPVVCNNEIHIVIAQQHYAWNGSEWRLIRTFDYSVRYNSIVELNNKIYVLGCRDRKRLFIQYSPETERWSSIGTTESIPMEVVGHNHDELADGINKWDKVCTVPFVGTYVYAFVYGNNIYASNNSKDIMKYDGSEWSVYTTMPFNTLHVAMYKDELYAYQYTTDTSSEYYQKVYKYDGNAWSVAFTAPNLDMGTNLALIVFEDKLHFIGGYYSNGAHYAWDGNTVTTLTNTTNVVLSLPTGAYVYNNELYVICGSTWCKYQDDNWVVLQNLPFSVYSNAASNNIMVHNGDVYVVPKNETYIMKHNGSEWVTFNNPNHAGGGYGLVSFNNAIHMINASSDVRTHYQYGGSRWELDNSTLPFSHPTSYQGWAFNIDNELHIIDRNSYYKYDGDEWINMNLVPNSTIKEQLIITWCNGEFYGIETTSISGIIYKYDGSTWVDSGLVAPYSNFRQGSFITYNNELHILSGYASGTNTLHYKYNGSEWVSVSTLPTGCAYGAVVYDGSIWFGQNVGTAHKWYQFNGSEWTLVCEPEFTFTQMKKNYAIHNNELYCTSNSGYLYKWDGKEWSKVGMAPVNNNANMLISFQGHIHSICGVTYSNHDFVYRNPRATMTFFAREAMKERRYIDDTDNIPWSESSLRNWLNGEHFVNLSSDLQNAVQDVIKMSSGYRGAQLDKSIDKCWIPSVDEMGVDLTDKFDYVNGLSEPYVVFTDSASRRRADHSGDYTAYHLRDLSVNGLGYVSHVGNPNFAARNPRGVVFGFCI